MKGLRDPELARNHHQAPKWFQKAGISWLVYDESWI
jgi:hypothetical protein